LISRLASQDKEGKYNLAKGFHSSHWGTSGTKFRGLFNPLGLVGSGRLWVCLGKHPLFGRLIASGEWWCSLSKNHSPSHSCHEDGYHVAGSAIVEDKKQGKPARGEIVHCGKTVVFCHQVHSCGKARNGQAVEDGGLLEGPYEVGVGLQWYACLFDQDIEGEDNGERKDRMFT